MFLLISFVHASGSSIKGTVSDAKNDDVLLGANVLIENTDLGAATDENGFYEINNVPIGLYTLRAMFIGYETYTTEIRIESNQEYTIMIDLKPSAIKIQETKVTGEKRKEKVTGAPAAMEIISSRDIKGKTTTNMGAYLKGLKGVDFTSSGINNYSISVRGFNSSFSTRLLTLSDGRVASIPALRVINYSSIPQSMEDVDKIEVILGPATALYGANAHSGVVNIISKPPSVSEGFSMSFSGSNDKLQLRKINGRFAKKISNSVSVKLSGSYLHAYDWPFISEEEYKSHLYPWTLSPGRTADGKDNNPWDIKPPPDSDPSDYLTYATNNDGIEVRIGNGEPNHGDLDGDGVAGEDWFNGYDDDGDGKIDEDYFTADGIDNDGDGEIDEGIDYASDLPFDGVDNDHNGIVDDEAGSGYIDAQVKPWGADIDNNIIVQSGRKDSLITDPNGNIIPNLYYLPNLPYDGGGQNLKGSYKYNENEVKFEFDIYNYDFGLDGLPGDPFLDTNDDGIWNNDETIVDCGNDAFCWGDSNGDGFVDSSDNSDEWIIGEPYYVENLQGNMIWVYGPDSGENDGIRLYDTGENDGLLDTGDKIYSFQGEAWTDTNGDNIWNPGEKFIDLNNDGQYTPPDYTDNYLKIDDRDGDGLSDYPDNEIDNRKVDFRIDYDPNQDFNMTFRSGYSWTKTQMVTGTGRYLADGFEYKYYQLGSRYKNWFVQWYMNQSFSGDTRGYNLGNNINDKSKNYAFQIQNNFQINSLNTKFVCGADYFKTSPNTFGTILSDGPNGYDNDGDNSFITNDGIDNDGDGEVDDLICSDGQKQGLRDGKLWDCGEGIDEPDEFDDPTSNEYGIYYQSTTDLFGTSRYQLITAARLDYHDLLNEGAFFAPKAGFIYKPDSKSSMRFTYGKAQNTPNSITLFTDLFVGSLGGLKLYLRGNKDGTPYCRVGEPCFGSEVYNVVEPSFYSEDGKTIYKFGTLNNPDYFDGYNERVEGAPYFYKIRANETTLLAGDMLPLDTSTFLIFVPELNGEGVLYSPEESFNLPDVDPIRTEKIQTIEFGYKGFLGSRTHFTFDAYVSYYEDFFSPPTIITPLITQRVFDEQGNEITSVDNLDIVGLMPVNDIGTYPPYGTAWNGLDDDGDWIEWADEFGWWDDKDGDGNPMDPGEWGGVLDDGEGDIFHPYEVLPNQDGYPVFENSIAANGDWIPVGIDEAHSSAGLNEYEPVNKGIIGSDGNPVTVWGNASNITDIVLSPMNYGEVWMRGVDFGLTHFLSEKLIMDCNVSWYGTTEFYNELTKKNDPINAPKWKWNASIKWNSFLGDIIFNFRHVDRFKWRDGIWAGTIGPYNILDIFYTYKISDNLDLNISALNINNDVHKELVGGAYMGRQIVMRLTSSF